MASSIFGGRALVVSRPRATHAVAPTTDAADTDAAQHRGSPGSPLAAGLRRPGSLIFVALLLIITLSSESFAPLLFTREHSHVAAVPAPVAIAASGTPSGTPAATPASTGSQTAAATSSVSAAATSSVSAALTSSHTAAPSVAASPSAASTSLPPSASALPPSVSGTSASTPASSASSAGGGAAGIDTTTSATDDVSLVIPRKLPAASDARAALLRSSAGARQRFWFDCLDASPRLTCRPDVAAVGGSATGNGSSSGAEARALPLSAWRKHVTDVLTATARFRTVPVSSYAGYSGPWVENAFIAHFLGGSGAAAPTDWTALDAFYPLVPIFAQWTDGTFGSDTSTHDPALSWVRSGGDGLLRRDVLYAALSQHDRGEPASGLPCLAYRNVVVFSGGGWGSVPIPLIMGQREHVTGGDAAAAAAIPRSLVASFVGSMWLGRDAMVAGWQASTVPKRLVSIGSGDWRGAARRSAFVLAPRGYGRSSFRLYEMLQFGRVPIYLGDDTVWVPHQHAVDLPFSGLDVAAGSRPPALVPASSNGIDMRDYGGVPPSAEAARPAWGVGGWSYDALPETAMAAAQPPAGTATHILNDGGMWGPGGVGFAMRYADIPAFSCIACELLLPGSAARWRRVRVLPLHRYGPGGGDGRSCPCDAARWEAVLTSLTAGGGGDAWALPSDSLVAEMERRVAAVAPSFFNYDAVMRSVQRFVADPLYFIAPAEGSSGSGYDAGVAGSAPLRCVPKPDGYGVPDAPLIERRRRRALRRGGDENATAPEAAPDLSLQHMQRGRFSPLD